jgi:feruloyl-CoA synthase
VLGQRNAWGTWRTVSYAEAFDAVRRLASALRASGCSLDRPLLVLSENSVELALLTWAAHYAGIPVAPVSPAYCLTSGTPRRLIDIVALVRPGLVFVQDGLRYANALEAVGLPRDRQLAVEHVPEGAHSFDAWSSQAADGDIDAAHDRLDTSAPAKLMFTSGSTGAPKAVVITHAMLVAAQEMTAQIVLQRPAGPLVQVDWLPWHHVMGGNVVLGRTLRFGGTLYIDEGRPLPGRFQQTLANLREIAPSYYFNVPAGYAMLAAELERDDAFAAHFLGKLEFVIGTAYGSTETTAAVMMRTWASAESASIGLPLPACELKLIPDPNLPGRYELRVQGPHLFRKYLGREGDSPERDEEDFYRVGDAVRFVEPGNPMAGLLFAGRFSDDFKLANGTWVRTGALRQSLLRRCSPVLREAVIFGDGRDCVVALAWLDARACASMLGLPGDADERLMAHHPALQQWLAQQLAQLNEGVSGASLRIEQVGIETTPLSGEAYELTDKGSINARAVADRRAGAIGNLYEEIAARGG